MNPHVCPITDEYADNCPHCATNRKIQADLDAAAEIPPLRWKPPMTESPAATRMNKLIEQGYTLPASYLDDEVGK